MDLTGTELELSLAIRISVTCHGSNILSARQGDTRRGIMRTEAIQEKKREETRQPSMPISGGKNIQHEVEWRIKYRF